MKINCKSRLGKKLVNKSVDAFIYAIETFNKPSISYRVETFSYLICNSWELLLKAYWIETRGRKSIYYVDKPDRTVSLEFLVKNTFTNENDPIRKNLETIIKLRNLSTHFITEEYESIYTPFFQACVMNYIDKIDEYFSVDMNTVISYPMLAISTYTPAITPNSFKHKYGVEVYKHYIQALKETNAMLQTPNEKIAMSIDINIALVKNPAKADVKVALDRNSEDKAVIIKEVHDVNKAYPYNQKRAIKAINERIVKRKIPIEKPLNQYSFQLICEYFDLFNNEKMRYKVRIDTAPRKMYSNLLLDFLVNEISKDPSIVSNIKKKVSPRSKGF